MPASAQEAAPSGLKLGLRVGGLVGTRLIADDIGQSILPDSLIGDRFQRDTIEVTMGVIPDLTLVAGFQLDEATELQLAAGYAFGSAQVGQAERSRDAGTLAIGHATLAIRKPVRGFLGRAGAGVLWMHGGSGTVFDEMRTLNPLVELAAAKSWPVRGFDVELGVVGQGVHLSSGALEARAGTAGMVYRAGVELAIARRVRR